MVLTLHLHVVGFAERQVKGVEWVDAGHFELGLGVGQLGVLVGGCIDSSWVADLSLSLGRFGEDFAV